MVVTVVKNGGSNGFEHLMLEVRGEGSKVARVSVCLGV